MSHVYVRNPEDAVVHLANELDHLAQQPRLAQGDYEAQAIGALCRAAAAILRCLPDGDASVPAHDTGRKE